jgi:hypothetical protein
VVIGLTALTLVLLSVVGGMKMVAADLHAQVDIAHQAAKPDARSPIGARLSALLAPETQTADPTSLAESANDLDQHADRLLEATAVVALAGMLLGLIVVRPSELAAAAGARDASRPVANTSSNGRV